MMLVYKGIVDKIICDWNGQNMHIYYVRLQQRLSMNQIYLHIDGIHIS